MDKNRLFYVAMLIIASYLLGVYVSAIIDQDRFLEEHKAFMEFMYLKVVIVSILIVSISIFLIKKK